MGSRGFPSHQLSNGLYVSGRPEQPKERTPTMRSVAMPYTGGDIKKSGELGKMFDIPMDGSKSRKSGQLNNAPSRTGSFVGAASHSGPILPNTAPRSVYTTSGNISSGGMSASVSMKKTNSGPLNKHGEPVKKSSGPQSGGVTRQNSGPIPPVLPTTGLITSGPLNSAGAPRKVSGPLEFTGSMKSHSSVTHNPATTTLRAGLTVETSKAKISQLFRDCGNIREIVIHKVKTNDVVATVEFEDRASVLAAQTKDKKLLNGVEVTVSLAWRSTLYVTNFPEDANDEWIRNKFSPFGNIFDVRWPSKRFKSTRRFCYIQFTAPESAEGAISLHNLEVAPNQKMVVLISDPARKQTRSDTNANDREIYITCLSKFVQEPDLRKLFTQFGEIKGIRLILNQAGHSKGFAFVEFENEMSAKAALAMNNVELKKKRIGVTISSGKGLSLVRKNTAFTDEAKLSSVTDHRSRSVKVSNLPEGSQEALIQQAFEPFGKVLKTITYPETNEALVEFALGKDAGRVFLHKEPIVINGQHVEVSVPITSVKVGLPTSNSSFTPLLPRSTVKGQKSRIGLGSASTAARLVPKASSLNQNVTQSSEVKDLETPNRNPSVPSSTNVGKTQSDFRKMLG